MSKQKPEYAQNTWQDVAVAVADWEAHYGVRICAQIMWDARLSPGGFVEVIVNEGATVGRGQELVRRREAFPARKMSGQPGAVMWAISTALRDLEGDMWNWSAKMRREATRQA